MVERSVQGDEAVMVDLPLCLQQLRSTLSEEERSRSSCHGSGSRPSLSGERHAVQGEPEILAS